ncbi:MAG TPA: queuosine precursor transporter [Thermomicrobiales bacterium]
MERKGLPAQQGRTGAGLSWSFVVVVAAFIACLITANIISVKLITVLRWTVPAGVIIFPIAYIVGDVLTEVYGYASARRVIWLGFACNALVVAAVAIAGELPAPDFWDGQAAYDRILGYTWRLLAASFAAYLVGEFANAIVLARLKVMTGGRFLWLRTISSTVIGQGLDSLVFITIAFAGTAGMDLDGLRRTIVTQWLIKTAYEVIATPLTYLVVSTLKRIEGQDAYDYDADFNPFALTQPARSATESR